MLVLLYIHLCVLAWSSSLFFLRPLLDDMIYISVCVNIYFYNGFFFVAHLGVAIAIGLGVIGVLEL